MMVVAPLRPSGPSRERLARTALRLFAERGYAAVSNREIVAACGLTKGAIYWYFESKEDLFRTIVGEALQSFQERLAAVLAPARGWEERLRAMFSLLADVLDEPDDPHRDLLVLLVSRHHRIAGAERMVGAADDGLRAWVTELLGERGGSAEETRELAILVHTAGLGIVAQAAAGRAVARPALNALLRLLGAGELRPRSGR